MAETAAAVCGEIRMRYARFGSGEDVLVMLPGMSVSSVAALGPMLEVSCAEFAKRFTVYLFDRREEAPEGYSLTDMADDTAAVMTQLGIRSAAFYGTSQGGMIALALAERYPERVRALVMGSSLMRSNPSFTAVMRNWRRLALAGGGRPLSEVFTDDVFSQATLEQFREALVRNGMKYEPAELRNFIRMTEACLPDALDGCRLAEGLRQIACPVLIMASRGDRVTTFAGAEDTARQLGDRCEFYAYGPEYGHAVYDEAPDFRSRACAFFEKALQKTQ